MTFLAPLALVAGALAAVGLVALHLVARQRPAAYPLPTARFVPDRRTLVSRLSRRPRDLLLLLVRVLLVLSAAAAFARPVLTPRRTAVTRVLLVDRSAAVADFGEALQRAREIASDGVPTQVLAFDSAVVVLESGQAGLDSLTRLSQAKDGTVGSISAAMTAARRLGADLGATSDSVELVLVSPLAERELDDATDTLRALWPGNVRLVRVSVARDTSGLPTLERAIGDADVLGPALGNRVVMPGSRALRLVRRVPSAADSAYARSGGVVVRWNSIGTRESRPTALAMGDDVIVASLGRASIGAQGVVLARWADGTPAAVERALGDGCMREVSVGVPIAGDVPLSPAFQRIVNGLTDACGGARGGAGGPVSPERLRAIVGPAGLARGSALARGTELPTPVASWLLGFALACALAELFLRRSRDESAMPEAE